MYQTILAKLRALAFLSRVAAIAAIAALGVAAVTISPVAALQVDQTRNFPARQTPDQQMSYYRITVNFNDQGISAGQQFGALPAGAYIYAIDAYVTTAFNAATTNVVTVGTTKASANEIVASGISGNPLATGVLHLTSAAGLGMAVTNVASPIPLFVKYAQTGTAATTGQIVIVIAFVANNDM
ncbi:hypothetical protein [Bradyrhizobium betae]|uniref:Uncharacterized protein n=1 Tax=Bradyrhizobium betae TaxID=244734 RepID=A0A5P6NYT4_9BRAD|nr:hypothetical protein [Bradyrhizobium betae]MCS3725502.1 hypothetical protein [Bradyrhizobium betae]QFI71210.1 hypothetical protein F8237_01770 [Bradyrhizobium betae]